MMKHQTSSARMARVALIAALAVIAVGLAVRAAPAHCDGLDGPVVKAAQKALQTGDVNQVLIWVRPQDEDEIKAFSAQAQPASAGVRRPLLF